MSSDDSSTAFVFPTLDAFLVREHLRGFLAEDLATGDVTTQSCVPSHLEGKAVLYARDPAVLVAGLEVCEAVFRLCDDGVVFAPHVHEGHFYANPEKKMVIASVQGRYSALLRGERVALNLMARMSGVAKGVRAFAEKLQDTSARLLDTRKTMPGLKIFEKYAFALGAGVGEGQDNRQGRGCGGVGMHRYNLAGGVLIKDNHLVAVGSLPVAVQRCRSHAPVSFKVEVEASSFAQVREAYEAGADMIMLDNMSCELMEQCVDYVKGRVPLEASGNITLDRIEAVARTGVDYISTSAPFASPPADLSLQFMPSRVATLTEQG